MESLADVGLSTVQRFKLLEEVKQLSVPNQVQEWPTNLFRVQFDRVELWAVNLGLFVMGHGSLDYRIRDSGSMRESIYMMIKNLNRSLDEGRKKFANLHQRASVQLLYAHTLAEHDLTLRSQFSIMSMATPTMETRTLIQIPRWSQIQICCLRALKIRLIAYTSWPFGFVTLRQDWLLRKLEILSRSMNKQT
jgi:hypothetical protein